MFSFHTTKGHFQIQKHGTLKSFPLTCTCLCYFLSLLTTRKTIVPRYYFCWDSYIIVCPLTQLLFHLTEGNQQLHSYHLVKSKITYEPMELISKVREVRLYPSIHQAVTAFHPPCLLGSHIGSGSNIQFHYRDHQSCFEPFPAWLGTDSLSQDDHAYFCLPGIPLLDMSSSY